MNRYSPSTHRVFKALAFVTAAFVLAACANDAPLDTRSNLAGPEARDIEGFLRWVLWISYAVFAAVLGATLWSWFKYRIKTEDYEDDEFPKQISHNNTLEIAWTAAPALLLAVIAIFTIGLHQSLNSSSENPIALEVAGTSVDWEPEIVVVGQQWWWEYQYHFGDVELTAQRVETLPNADITTATQMVIPTNMEIELEITSRDVIHSHWIPSLNGKRDAVPGRQSAPWKIQADEPGVFFGQCTEFCGLSHSRMRMQVIALPMEEFQEWVTAQMQGVDLSPETAAYVAELAAGATLPPEDPEQRAIDTFRTKCASCHVLDGVTDGIVARPEEQLVSGAAPNLTHFGTRTTFAGGIVNVYDTNTGEFNRNQLGQWLRDPSSIKANFTEPVSETDSRLRGMPNLGLTTQEVDDLVGLLEMTGAPPTVEGDPEFLISETGVE